MARGYRENTGWCPSCTQRRLVRRRNQFFTTWRCQACGAAVAAVGDWPVQRAALLHARAEEERALEAARRRVEDGTAPPSA